VIQEILPAKWVYASFCAEDLDRLEEVEVYQGDGLPLTPTVQPKMFWRSWLFFGSVKTAKAKAEGVWRQLRGDKNWRLLDIDYYANTYKVYSRACIRRGEFTPEEGGAK
jgi:hypothetical protein